MNIYVDVDLHQIIQSPGARSAANTFEIKSQDTLEVNLFFCSEGVVLDLGTSPVLGFGLVAKSAIGTLLVYENVFVRFVDLVNGVYYQCLAVFNTTQMATTLGTLSPLPCILEIRFQLADGEIVHTLDQAVTIDRTILVEGGTPAATVIAVYPDPSVLEVKTNKDQHSGYAALDSAGHLTPSVIPSTVELIATRDVASGHAGLDSATLLLAAELPVDGVTTTVVAGKLVAVGPALGVVAVSTEPFTVPAVGSNVAISVATTSLTPLAYYVLSNSAGTYQYVSAVDSTHGTFMNAGGSLNAVPTTVIPLGCSVTLSGPLGATGPAPWKSASTIAAWNSATTTYSGAAPASVVTYLGGTWVAIAPVTGTAPGVTSGQWVQIAAPGSTPLMPSLFIPTPAVAVYPILFSCPGTYATITYSARMKSGTCTIAINRNGTSLGSVSASSTVATAGIGTTLNPADLIELNITAVSSPVNLSFQFTLSP